MKSATDVTSSLVAIVSRPLQQSRVRIFPKRFEEFCLVVPAVLVGLLILDYLTLQLLSGGSEKLRLNRFVTSLLFFNSIHVYFTFAYLVTVPEIKAWISEITDGRPWKFWLEIAVVAAICVVPTAIAFFNFQMTSTRLPIISFIFVGIIPYHHMIAQNFGLSMLYNSRLEKQIEFTEEEKTQARTCSSRERLGFRCFMAFFFVSILLRMSGVTLGLGPQWIKLVRYSLYGLTSLSVLGIVFNSLAYPHAAKSNKPLFLSRLLFYIILPFSFIADSALRACHGTEYLCVTGAVAKNSSMPKAIAKQYAGLVVLLALIGTGLLVCRRGDGLVSYLFDGNYDQVPFAIQALAFVSIVATYTHYYLDRRLFRFRNKSNRDHVLPLLDEK